METERVVIPGIIKNGLVVPQSHAPLPEGDPCRDRHPRRRAGAGLRAEFDAWERAGEEAWAQIDQWEREKSS